MTGITRELPYMVTTILLCLVVYDHENFKKLFAYESSPIDWCEENYVHSAHIAEFFNTISSFAMFFGAIFGRHVYNKPRYVSFEPTLWILWMLFASIGIGSVIFHGTLSVAGQVLDELPIVLMTITSLILLIPKRKWRPSYRATLLNQR